MLRLSESAIHTLKIVSNNFQQAAIAYDPLFHQRFLPWDGLHESRIEDEQWLGFIEANRSVFDEDDWWECSPAYCGIGLTGNFLNRWFGNPDGLDRFKRLVESALLVLRAENFSGVDDSEIPFRFRHFEDWVSTIHNWAFRFQMPFLRSRMKLWNSDTQGTQAFDELTKKWIENSGVSFPAYPLCWTLYDDVFTCSAMAIEAMCNPSLIKATNEPWTIAADEPKCPLIAVDHDRHRLVETPVGFIAIVAGASKPLGSRKYRDGMARLACLLANQTETVEALTIKKVNFETQLGEMAIAHVRQQRVVSLADEADDPESFERMKSRIKELRWIIEKTKDERDYAQQEEAQSELDKIFETYEFGKKGKDKGKLFRKVIERDPQVKVSGDSVRATIVTAIRDLQQSAPEFSGIFESLKDSLKREDGFLSIRLDPEATPWVVTSLCDPPDSSE